MKIKKILKSGQSLIEVLVAIALASLILPAILTGIVTSTEGKPQEIQRVGATALLHGTQEAVRSVRETDWQAFASNGVYHPVVSGAKWSLVGGSEQINGYTRQVVVSDVLRDAGGNIVASGGTMDPSTKKVQTTISWNSPIASSVTAVDYLTRYVGNKSQIYTTQADFATPSAQFVNTQVVNNSGGEVQLAQGGGTTTTVGNKFTATAAVALGSLNTKDLKADMRFTAKNSRQANAVRIFLYYSSPATPQYRVGIQADNGSGLPSGVFLASGLISPTAAGWQTVTLTSGVTLTAGNIYHIVIQYESGTVAIFSMIIIGATTPNNLLYPYDGSADTNANTLYNSSGSWVVQNQQPVYELDYTGNTVEGNPYSAASEVPIYGSNYTGETFNLANSATALSISFSVRVNVVGPAGNLSVVLVDLQNNSVLADQVLTTPILTRTTYLYKTYTLATAQSLSAGRNYRVYLKSPTSTSSAYYIVDTMSTTNASNFNSITYDGTNSFLTKSADSGASWTDSANADVGGYYFTVQASSAASGTYSVTLDAGKQVAFNNVLSTTTAPSGTSIAIQVATNNDNATWVYFAPDANGAIPLVNINGRYIRVLATFNGNPPKTPVLYDISINYSP